MPNNHHINPRFRAYGKARIDITQRATSEAEFQQLWRPSANSFPFIFSQNEWKFSVEYKVDDFAAEVGFYIDILGFNVLAFSPSYAQFTDPAGEFCISIAALRAGEKSTPAEAIRLQFKVSDILALAGELEKRGILFEHKPEPIQPGSSQAAGYFRTPHGICIDLWGEIAQKPDIHELLEDEADDAETDAIIQRLLNLPAKEDIPQAEPAIAEDDEPEDEFEVSDDTQLSGDKTEEPESQSLPAHPAEAEQIEKKTSQPSRLVNPPRPQPVHYSGKPFPNRSNNPPRKPSWDQRGNGELTYQPVDDSEIPDEDDL